MTKKRFYVCSYMVLLFVAYGILRRYRIDGWDLAIAFVYGMAVHDLTKEI
ncbi:MAG: hypothetical protein WC455_10370 [Dehalococcoidia bacterium]|jgi:hypothetical protein